MRQDLLDAFLERSDSVLIWLVSGEREVWYRGIGLGQKELGFSPYRYFTKAFEYSGGKAVQIVERREKDL